MKIKNFDQLAVNELRRDALNILEAGLQAIDTKKVIEDSVKIIDETLYVASEKFVLKDFKRIFLIGVGKCASEAALAVEMILGDHLTDGVVIDVKSGERPKRVKFYLGSHPLPSEKNVEATKAMIELLKQAEKDDLIIFLISGGGSVLLCQPENFTCQQESTLTKFLFDAGATIEELNTVRKHLSLARGGYLAKYAYPARAVALIFSDVPGNNLNFIASGPTVLDETTVVDAKKIIERYKISEKFPSVLNNLIETPKDAKYFEKMSNVLVVTNLLALEAMKKEAQKFGYNAEIKNTELVGDAKIFGKQIIAEFEKTPAGALWLYGGETTVRVKGRGVGGRNQTLVLAGLEKIKKYELLLASASDGRDNSDFAGAICDTITLESATELGLIPKTYLADDNSFGFFKQVGNYLEMGYTGSNVSDLILIIKNKNN
ncbi:MAG: DUF4147 domain-containing protein [Patescibacteria group bacterium]